MDQARESSGDAFEYLRGSAVVLEVCCLLLCRIQSLAVRPTLSPGILSMLSWGNSSAFISTASFNFNSTVYPLFSLNQVPEHCYVSSLHSSLVDGPLRFDRSDSSYNSIISQVGNHVCTSTCNSSVCWDWPMAAAPPTGDRLKDCFGTPLMVYIPHSNFNI